MKVFSSLVEGFKSIIEGVGRIFQPTDDQYPATGVVPYSGEPDHSS